MSSKPKPTPRPKTRKYSEEDVRAACKAVVMDRTSLRQASALFGVPFSTIKDRLNGKRPFHEIERTVITSKDEERLIEWMKECVRRGFGRTLPQVQQAVQTILNDRKAVTIFKDNYPGRKWVSLFLQRHQDVTLRTPRALGSRRPDMTEETIRSWFVVAEREIRAIDSDVLEDPSRIFHCDEIGFELGGGAGFTKVVAGTEDRRVYQTTSGTHKKQITVLACGSASGDVLNPLIVFPCKRFLFNPVDSDGFPNALIGRSDNGWMDSDLFHLWMDKCFIPETRHLPRPILLFADRHKTHLTVKVSELCKDHGIILFLLPSHASHVVQPLDLTLFKVLKQVWREEVLTFQEDSCKTVGKAEFSGVFKKAWDKGIHKDTMISGFRAAGIYPWDPDHVDMTKLAPSRLYVTRTDPTTTETLPSATMTTTIEKIEADDIPTISDIPTVADNRIVIETVDFDDGLPDEPPSPTISPSAKPPHSPSLPSLSSDTVPIPSVCTLSSAPTPVNVNVSSSMSSSSQGPSISTNAAASSSSSFPGDDMSTRTVIDQLLELAAKAGLGNLVHYKTLHTLKREADEPEAKLFCQLYTRLLTETSIPPQQTPVRTFDNLPLPSSRSQQKRVEVLQSPNFVSGERFREYLKDVEEKKRKAEEEKERKKEREEKRKRVEEERGKKRKRNETEGTIRKKGTEGQRKIEETEDGSVKKTLHTVTPRV